jgi:hypothetical protein
VLLAVDPNAVRRKQRIAADKTSTWGKKILDFRAETTVKAIRKATAKGPKEQPRRDARPQGDAR